MKKFIIIASIIILSIVIIFFLLARFVGTSGLKVKEYKVSSDKITSEYHGLKIVHISDFHYGSIINEKEMKNLVNEINSIKPDIVVLTGDLIDERIPYDKDIIIKYLNDIKATLGKYAVSGNHDMPVDDFYDIIKQSDFINLDNTYKLIYKSNTPIIISGLSSKEENINIKTKDFEEYINTLENPIYSILLVHRPDMVDVLNLDNYDLILSGHSHNGQVNIPLIKNIFMPSGARKYNESYYNINNTDFYISSGLGTSKYKLRLFNKPSINLYRIIKK